MRSIPLYEDDGGSIGDYDREEKLRVLEKIKVSKMKYKFLCYIIYAKQYKEYRM